MATASRFVCIDPKETRRVVESEAGWPALRASVAAVVITTDNTAAQRRVEVRKSADETFGEFQAANAHREKKTGT